ncbi:monovalent cation:proton antiporter-2 (CPA2) family protein [Candidatus Symbiobacter mobilis]|uniref:CPA2 family monovalent cation:proton antiporter n=1 Tax=Candidatus Symbiobacter mobilis CR TaxID=946483 RepID=U5NA91_9BURK|nr:monovalent cation:proton antiporter-2 (CPA2) family protein [Candidatus Symbiobacter mobilis]AGX87168.1 CPA2 family monovalent cation:proton antiporter [Candidatus Symbiobacter mobilis CR]
MGSLELTLLYLLAAVLGVVVCRSLKLPPMLGYLAVGVCIGPHAMAVARDAQGVAHLGEFGVVFLMFVIGLEFHPHKLRAMRKHVLGLGLLQVVATVLLGTGVALVLGWAVGLGIDARAAFVLASALAMSSTAIVVKLMSERLELESEYGKRVMGVLLFQDLAVVPLLVLIPALGGPAGDMFATLLWAVCKATVLVVLLLVGGPAVMRWWLTLVARRKSEELFVLNILLVTLGLAWLTELAGLSMALGAFIAGMLISETQFKQQVETDIRPFHDVLLGLFFIGIGMLLDWRLVLERWPVVLVLLGLLFVFKAAVVVGVARLLGATPGSALRTGLYLAQAGEFGFVLLTHSHGIIPAELFNPVLAAMVLSMLATPLIVLRSGDIVMAIAANEWLMESVQMTSIARQSMKVRKHVIICGYGRCGQNLARMLEEEHIAYVALDLDPDRVRLAAAAGDTVVFGDAARLQALMAAGLARASAVVVTYLNTPSVIRVLGHIREHAPHVPVVVRTQDDHDLELLQRSGATEVVPEAIEGSLMLASHALALVGVPMRRVIRRTQEQRDARYALLRGYFRGADDAPDGDDMQQERLHSVRLPLGARCLGRTVDALHLSELHVQLVSLRRKTGQVLSPADATSLFEGDILLLSGKGPALEEAERRLVARSGPG